MAWSIIFSHVNSGLGNMLTSVAFYHSAKHYMSAACVHTFFLKLTNERGFNYRTLLIRQLSYGKTVVFFIKHCK